MDHTLALIIKSQQGDKEARDTIFEENAGLVYSVAKRFLGRGVEMEDLVQIGILHISDQGLKNAFRMVVRIMLLIMGNRSF